MLRRIVRTAVAKVFGEPAADAGGDARTARELSLPELLAEDLATHDRQFWAPGFWGIAAHRLAARAPAAPAVVRGPTVLAARLFATGVDYLWGIRVTPSTEVGRRVRIWHSGCILLDARSIGNDVHLRHDTTFGPLRARPTSGGADPHQPAPPPALPVIEDGADIGSGVCVLGGVTVGKQAFVGANSVVLKSVPAQVTVLGVPARIMPT
jgi:serine O-acetyltransferase